MFCDFAGYPFFHQTHGLFFPQSSAIFLLVVDLTCDKESMKRSSHYWASLVKCSSVFHAGKRHSLVIGSRKDFLSQSGLDRAITKLNELVAYLQTTFGQWFEFSGNAFFLNCRERGSKEMSVLRETLRAMKRRALKVFQ